MLDSTLSEGFSKNLNPKSQVLLKMYKISIHWKNKWKINIMMTCLILREDLLLGSTLERMIKEIIKISEKILQPVSKSSKWLKNLNDITPSPYFLLFLHKNIKNQSLAATFFYLNFPILSFAKVEIIFAPFKWPNYTNFYVAFFPLNSFNISSPPGWF